MFALVITQGYKNIKSSYSVKKLPFQTCSIQYVSTSTNFIYYIIQGTFLNGAYQWLVSALFLKLLNSVYSLHSE
jgi:hypothetical protein